MKEEYLIVHRSILPESYGKVLEVRKLLDSGKAKDVSEAAKQVGLSRSTYYKYKDFIHEPTSFADGRKAVLSLMLDHEKGVLSALLTIISDAGASVLTISQSLPVNGKANVMLSLDISSLTCTVAELTSKLDMSPGADNIKILSVE